MKSLTLMACFLLIFSACKKEDNSKTELWIYTSMYKDTIADLKPRLKKAFPGIKFQWYQAGSEDIASKVQSEILAGALQADVLISSDRFWYEEMANNGNLYAYKSPNTKDIAEQMKHAEGFYTTVSIPVMVMAYNREAVSAEEAPKSFKEMMDPKWKGKFSTGSPLSSGTNFTTMAMLQHHYGWEYIKGLKANETISDGGNSAVIRRLQSKERPVGWVLLENLLRFQDKDDRLQTIYPSDGVVTHANVMAITNKKGSDRTLAQRFTDWMLTVEGQEAMTRSYMYSPIPSMAPPKGAPPLSRIMSKAFPWTKKFLDSVTRSRVDIKEKYTEIMFQ
ncbi:MAG: iron(III) transport system substrate-binding protein [Bacteriovoracaceae bacterium]|jgi:iron(III) transport system substrate-binding protein